MGGGERRTEHPSEDLDSVTTVMPLERVDICITGAAVREGRKEGNVSVQKERHTEQNTQNKRKRAWHTEETRGRATV